MKSAATIGLQRLARQGIGSAQPVQPAEVVGRLGFVQAQDYLGALWAVGARLPGAREADIEQALAGRSIVRTWPARGTLHFVAAADVRWMLHLLTPRMVARSAGRDRQLGLDDDTYARSSAVMSRALEGQRQLSREALYAALEAAHISTAGQRGIHILGRLAQLGLICFGPRQGKQQTFVLLDEWLPRPGRSEPPRDQALAELARRYFFSRGPATLADFVWWSGLTTADARAGIETARPDLAAEEIDGQTYWQGASAPKRPADPPAACLLPAFDEYLVGYKDRSAVLGPGYTQAVNAGGGMLSPVIVIDGLVVGTWKRALKKETVVITPGWFRPPKKAQQAALLQAARRYGDFLERTAVVA